MSSTTPDSNWLTQESFDRLSNELEELMTAGRKDIAKKIEIAREEGDLKENGGYHAAKEEQGMLEARIRDMQQLLKTAEVREAPKSRGVVEVGTVITATIMGDEEKFLIANREAEADHVEFEVYSAESPLVQAILGLKVSEKTSYEAPNGRDIEVVIKAVDTYNG